MWSGTHIPYKVLRHDMHENRADLHLASFFSQQAFGIICKITSNSLPVMDRRLSVVNFEGTEGPSWFMARLLFVTAKYTEKYVYHMYQWSYWLVAKVYI
jgi:hypothetical protein